MISSFVRRLAERQATARALWEPQELLSDWQWRMFCDQSELRIADAGRRSGKTREFCVEMLDLAITRPNSRIAFAAKTETDAREIIWSDLWELIETYQLAGVSQKSSIRFPNGSTIRVTGAKDPQEAQRRFRGRGYDLVLVDEAQILPWLQAMIQQAIAPALIRGGRNGRLMLGGTPGDVPGVGYWEEICAGQHGQWSIHTATVRDNPSVIDVEKFLGDRAAELGGPTSVIFRREYLRERVAPDQSSGLVYHYDVTRNHFEALPDGGQWRNVIAVDLGHTRDTNALAVVGVTTAAPGLAWLREEWKAPRRLPLPELAAKILDVQKVYPCIDTVIDEGGLGTAIADELRRLGVNCTAADKLNVLASSDTLNAALTSGRLKIKSTSRTAQDLAILRWDPIELGKGRRKMAKFPHSDLEPCLRYAWPLVADLLDTVRSPPVLKSVDQVGDDDARRMRRKSATRAGEWRRYGVG